MKRFIEGLDRSQTTLLPDCIDAHVSRAHGIHRHHRCNTQDIELVWMSWARQLPQGAKQSCKRAKPTFTPTSLPYRPHLRCRDGKMARLDKIRGAVAVRMTHPFVGLTRFRSTATIKHATRAEAFALSNAIRDYGHPHLAAVPLICFEWLQRPENILAGHMR